MTEQPADAACEVAIDQMHAELDGALSPADARALAAHTETCASCRELRDSLRAIVLSAASLPRDLPPSRDLWPSIRARLRPRSARPRWLAPAAGVLLAAAALLSLRLLPEQLPPQAAPAAPLVAQADDLQRGIEDLERELQARANDLDPETLAVVQRNLAIIDAAIAETEAALARAESGPARSSLFALQQHKIELLRKITDLPQHQEG